MLKEIEYSESQQKYLKLKVSHVIDPGISYVSYKILLETNDPSFTSEESTTSRRYSEFWILHAMLVKQFPFIKFPSLPSKSPFKKRFDIDFIKKRESALQEYLEQLFLMKICLSSKALHLFLQSSLSMVDIKSVVNGEKTNVEKSESVVSTLKNLMSGQPVEGEMISNQNVDNENSSSEVSTVSNVDLVSRTSSPGSKRVSFCDQVTVAEIHAP